MELAKTLARHIHLRPAPPRRWAIKAAQLFPKRGSPR